MFNGVLSTPLRFVSNVSHIVTYLVVCHPTHAMGTEYPVKLQPDRNKAGGKKNLIWVAREKNKPLEYAYAEDNSHSCLGRRRNMISWIEGISFKVSFKTRKKNIAHNSVSLFPFLVISSHWRCSATRGVFRNFGNVTGKHLCQSFFFNKVAG